MAKLRTYGHNKTFYSTTHLDIETNSKGEVVAVWFRCQLLPFKQYNADKIRSRDVKNCYNGKDCIPELHAVVLKDKKVG